MRSFRAAFGLGLGLILTAASSIANTYTVTTTAGLDGNSTAAWRTASAASSEPSNAIRIVGVAIVVIIAGRRPAPLTRIG